MRPGNSSGRGGEPGSRTGGVISGCGLPGGIPGGGSAGVPGVDGGISGGSIGIGIFVQLSEYDNDDLAPMFRACRAAIRLFRRVADGPDVVPVGIEHEGAVIVRMVVRTIMRADAGRPVVAATGRHRRLVAGIDRGAVLCENRDMHRLVQRAFAADPEIRLAAGAESCGARALA